ncbi:MAG: GAF domain-containing sensor histidine kinase [Longimonas sp.]|uniref:GAF domain-containing sensor histidine kinase n=1 Tax=Longimonas sp. TaxID=2039626 RepID=UPI00334A29BD
MAKRRQEVVEQYNIVGTPPEEAFDAVVRHAADVTEAPAAMLNFSIEAEWFWCKAATGIDQVGHTFRSALCKQIMEAGTLTEINRDEENKPFSGKQSSFELCIFKTYVGVPLRTSGGVCIGTLCIFDTVLRSFSDADCRRLKDIATLVTHLLEQRRKALRSSTRSSIERPSGLHPRKSRQVKQRRPPSEQDFKTLKTSLLANISHEVRTPLTAIIGFAEILEDELDAPMAERASIIKRYGEQLNHTLQATMRLSELESGTHAIRTCEIDIARVVRSTVQAYEEDARRAGIKVNQNIPLQPVRAWGDQEALMHIVANVIDNAIKFNRPGGKVEVRIENVENESVQQAQIVVEDTGIGITEEAIPRVFEAFRQESEGVARSYEGVGIGLTIVKHLAEQMGGCVHLQSKKREGTSVTITLPMRPDK